MNSLNEFVNSSIFSLALKFVRLYLRLSNFWQQLVIVKHVSPAPSRQAHLSLLPPEIGEVSGEKVTPENFLDINNCYLYILNYPSHPDCKPFILIYDKFSGLFFNFQDPRVTALIQQYLANTTFDIQIKCKFFHMSFWQKVYHPGLRAGKSQTSLEMWELHTHTHTHTQTHTHTHTDTHNYTYTHTLTNTRMYTSMYISPWYLRRLGGCW